MASAIIFNNLIPAKAGNLYTPELDSPFSVRLRTNLEGMTKKKWPKSR